MSDNKFGNCCKCPPRMDLMREVTDYRSKNFSMEADIHKRFRSIHEYNDFLEANGYDDRQSEMKQLSSDYTCKSNESNKFYIDSRNYHQHFVDEMNMIEEPSTVTGYDCSSKKLLSVDKPDYTTRYINEDY